MRRNVFCNGDISIIYEVPDDALHANAFSRCGYMRRIVVGRYDTYLVYGMPADTLHAKASSRRGLMFFGM